MALTMKQEKFCQAYVLTGNASEAYRRSYDAGKMKPESVNRKAKELMDNVNISARVAELEHDVLTEYQVTVGSLVSDLRKAFGIAIEERKAGQAVAAVMGIAKICGLEKQVIEQTVKHGSLDDFYSNIPKVNNSVKKTK